MKSTSGRIHVIKSLNHAIINNRQVQVLEQVVTKPIAVEPFQPEMGDMEQRSMVAGRGLWERYRTGLDALRSAGHALFRLARVE